MKLCVGGLMVALVAVAGCSSSKESHPSDLSSPPDLSPGDASVDLRDAAAPDASIMDGGSMDLASPSPSSSPAPPDAGAPPDLLPGPLYISVTGSDTAPGNGSPAHPYKTLGKAASVAVAGQTIYAAPGRYPVTAATTLPSDVDLVAETAGTVTFTRSGSGSLTLTGSTVEGVIFDNVGLSILAGTVSLVGVQFADFADPVGANQSALNIGGTASVTLTPGATSNYLVSPSPCASLAYLSGQAQLTVHHGAIDGASANTYSNTALFNINDSSQLTLEEVTMTGGKTGAVLAQGSSNLFLSGTTIDGYGQTAGAVHAAVYVTGAAANITLNAVTITNSLGAGIAASGTATTGVVLLTNASTVKNSGVTYPTSGYGIDAAGTVSLNGASIDNNKAAGVHLQSGASLMTGTGTNTISGNGTYGVQLTGPNLVVISKTTIANNGSAGIYGVVSSSKAFDLGSSGGGNTFQSNGGKNLNLSAALGSSALTINASGNTWSPSSQGSNGAGQYTSATTFSATYNMPVSGGNVSLTETANATGALQVVVAK